MHAFVSDALSVLSISAVLSSLRTFPFSFFFFFGNWVSHASGINYNILYLNNTVSKLRFDLFMFVFSHRKEAKG